MTKRHHWDVLVVGAGISGLAVATLLYRAGKRVCVLEARHRAGGRVESIEDEATGRHLADLGPTWIWTPYQPLASRWLDRLGLTTFEQYDTGLGVFEPTDGAAPVAVQLPQSFGSMRVVGGTGAIVEALIDALPPGTIHTDHTVTHVSVERGGVEITVDGDPMSSLAARQVVIAVPPRIATSTIDWHPALPESLVASLAATPTWMAPHAKAVVLYERPFWRERGLSGRIVSQRGPLSEVHDHSAPEGMPAALFGFVGWPAAQRAARGNHALSLEIERQLERCLGPAAPTPLAVHVRDWATCPQIANRRDLDAPIAHPSVGPESLRRAHLGGRLRFCVSETAAVSPGLIEGAFAAAEDTAAGLLAELSRAHDEVARALSSSGGRIPSSR